MSALLIHLLTMTMLRPLAISRAMMLLGGPINANTAEVVLIKITHKSNLISFNVYGYLITDDILAFKCSLLACCLFVAASCRS